MTQGGRGRRQDTVPDLALLLPSWELSLRAERKSAPTVKVYGDGVRRFLAWAKAAERPAVLDRATVTAFVAELLEQGAEPATARSRHLALRRFSGWLVEEGEAARDELVGTRPPKLDVKVVDPLSDIDLKALIAACSGPALMDRRDEAIVRLMLETGARAGEVVGLAVADIDLGSGTALVRRGKGGRGRVVPFGPHTGRALDRYLRLRRGHRLSASSELWLGDRGKEFSYDGLYKALKARAEAAGITGFRPHRLRHTAAHRWLAAGGSEGGLMAVAGWTRPDMLLRYTRARASERAATEARTLNLGGRVKPRRPSRPRNAYTGIVAGLWPQLGDEDPRQYDMDKAYSEVVTDRRLNLKTGEWEAIPSNGTRALLRITCEPELHFRGVAPMLAEVWKTSRGLLFISRLPGAVFGPKDDPKDPFAPPTAVLSCADLTKRAAGQSTTGSQPGWEPVPVTIVRILLNGPVVASLWVKCADHGPANVDRLRLNRVYERDQVARRECDTLKPAVVRLQDVGALSSER